MTIEDLISAGRVIASKVKNDDAVMNEVGEALHRVADALGPCTNEVALLTLIACLQAMVLDCGESCARMARSN